MVVVIGMAPIEGCFRNSFSPVAHFYAFGEILAALLWQHGVYIIPPKA